MKIKKCASFGNNLFITFLLLLFLGWAIPNAFILKDVYVARQRKERERDYHVELVLRRGIERAGGFERLFEMSFRELRLALKEALPDQNMRFPGDFLALRGTDGQPYLLYYDYDKLRFGMDASLKLVGKKDLLKAGISDAQNLAKWPIHGP